MNPMTSIAKQTDLPDQRPQEPERRRLIGSHNSHHVMFYGFLLPAIVLTLVFTVYPLIQSLPLMFQRWPGYGKPRYIGIQNITKLFTDPEFFAAIGRTLWLTAATAAGTVIIGTALAIAFYRKIPLTNTLKFLAFFPVILPPAVYALAWKNALDPTLGWVNKIPGLSHNWLSDPDTAMWAVIFVSTIQYVGIPMILMLSASGIHRDLGRSVS
jgi:ABC-type sugar transport system permease subunit